VTSNNKRQLTPDEIRYFHPVVAVREHRNGVCVVVRKTMIENVSRETIGGPRGQIKRLTARARSHLAFVVAATSVEFRSILTLTYGNFWTSDMAVSKSHLNAILTYLRYTQGAALSYVWVMEFQQRGAPHYHLLLSIERPPEHECKELAYRWSNTISPKLDWRMSAEALHDVADDRNKVYRVHRHPSAWENIKSPDGAVRYMTKYCLKANQKNVPPEFTNVGRFYGYSRDVKASIGDGIELRLSDDELQLVLKTFDHKTASWDLPPKYIFGLELNLVEADDTENVSRETLVQAFDKAFELV
jgi:hypothetical protein